MKHISGHWPHLLLAIPFWVSLLSPFVALSATCVTPIAGRTSVSSVPSIVAKILPPPNNEALALEVRRVARALTDVVTTEANKMDTTRQQRFLTELSNIRTHDVFGSKGDSAAAVDFSESELPYFTYLNFLDGLTLAFNVRHEISHFTRLEVGLSDPAEAQRYIFNKIHGRRLGIYREESYAYGDLYDFIRSIYTSNDLARLEKLFPPPADADTRTLTTIGVWSPEHKQFQSLHKVKNGPNREVFLRFAKARMEQSTLEDVKDALTQTRSQFVRARVILYKDQQSEWERERKVAQLRKPLLIATGLYALLYQPLCSFLEALFK